jgi:hypothetical protein
MLSLVVFLKKLMNVLWLGSMFIETSIISLFGIVAFVAKNVQDGLKMYECVL